MTAAQGVPVADPVKRLLDPLPVLLTPLHPEGIEFEVSCPYDDKRTSKNGLPTIHGGVDRMLRRARRAAEPTLPDYDRAWWCPSKGTRGGFEVPILASAAGIVTIAGWGISKHGEKLIEIAIDHGDIPGLGPVRFEHVHCARLLVKPGQTVGRGQPVGIIGHTGTDRTHDHFEIWADAGPRGDHDGRAERGEKVDPEPLLARMLQATYLVDPAHPDFDPARLTIPA